MIFLLDENFPKMAQALLAARGHQVIDIRGTEHEGASDATIFQLAQAYRAVLLSTDRDFFHTIPHLAPNHHGVVVIALRQPNRENILARLKWFLDWVGDKPIAGKAYQLRDRAGIIFPADG